MKALVFNLNLIIKGIIGRGTELKTMCPRLFLFVYAVNEAVSNFFSYTLAYYINILLRLPW